MDLLYNIITYSFHFWSLLKIVSSTGKDYNIQTELNMLQQSVEDAKRNKASFRDLLKPYILKPLLISLTLMFFQQYSGVNPVLFNLTTIFEVRGICIFCSDIFFLQNLCFLYVLCLKILIDKVILLYMQYLFK